MGLKVNFKNGYKTDEEMNVFRYLWKGLEKFKRRTDRYKFRTTERIFETVKAVKHVWHCRGVFSKKRYWYI